MSDKHMRTDPTWAVVPEPDRPGDVPCLCRGEDGVEPRWREDSQLWHLRVGGMVYGVSRRARGVIAGALGLVDPEGAAPTGGPVPEGFGWPRVDGKPVMPGDVMWDREDGTRHKVVAVTAYEDGSVGRRVLPAGARRARAGRAGRGMEAVRREGDGEDRWT